MTRNKPGRQAAPLAPVDECATSSTLDPAAVAAIREALHIGLASFGELERLDNACECLKLCGTPVSDELNVIHPTGASDTVSRFATALRYLEDCAPRAV